VSVAARGWLRPYAASITALAPAGDTLNLLEEAERLYFRGVVPDIRPIAALKARGWVA